MFATFYLSISFVQLQRAQSAIEQIAIERGHKPEDIITKPTMANIILWRSTYKNQGNIYIDAVRVGLEARVYQGSSVQQFDIEKDTVAIDRTSVLYEDIKRFDSFSDVVALVASTSSACERKHLLGQECRPRKRGRALDCCTLSQETYRLSVQRDGETKRQHATESVLGKNSTTALRQFKKALAGFAVGGGTSTQVEPCQCDGEEE